VVVEKFLGTIQKITSATTIQDLRTDKGLKLEKLKRGGGYWSMRLSLKYRLEVIIVWEDEKQTIGRFFIKTISNHYSR
jgi:plasmid maintenance system killer protein